MLLKENSRKVDEYGRVIFDMDGLFESIYNDEDIEKLNFVSDTKLEEYNNWCEKFQKTNYKIQEIQELSISPEEEHNKRSSDWFIPEEYKNIDVRSSLLARCLEEKERVRVNIEMDLYEERNLIPLLRFMFYLVDYFRENNIVWGVGRGSSCASYCLFLIGVHKIDSLKFDLPISEFLK